MVNLVPSNATFFNPFFLISIPVASALWRNGIEMF